MRRIRVAHVLPSYAAEGVNLAGGGERYAVRLARALRSHADVTLVTFGPRRRLGEFEGLRHLVLPSWPQTSENPVPLSLPGLVRGFDLVHSYQLRSAVTSTLAVLCRALGRPLVVTDVGGGGRSLMYRARLHTLIPAFTLLSDFSRRLLPQEARARAVVTLGGVDLSEYPPAAGPRRRQALLVARIMPHKGIENLVRASGDDLPVVIAGRVVDQAYHAALREMARDRPVTFRLDPDDATVRRLYSESAVTVSCSVYRDMYGRDWPMSELLGLTLLESMASGTPVVCTDVGGMPEYVRHEVTGFVIPPNDPGAVRRAVLPLLDDPALNHSMGESARNHVAGLTWDAVADRVLTVYHHLLEPKHAPA